LKICILDSLLLLLNTFYPSLIMYISRSLPIYTHPSLESLFHWTFANMLVSCCTNTIFHMNLSLLHWKFNFHSSFGHSPKSLTTQSLHFEIVYNRHNLSLRMSSPTHLSGKNLTLLPSPKLHLILLSFFQTSLPGLLHHTPYINHASTIIVFDILI